MYFSELIDAKNLHASIIKKIDELNKRKNNLFKEKKHLDFLIDSEYSNLVVAKMAIIQLSPD